MIFAPASITCIFSPSIGDTPQNSGSMGVGFTIDLGSKAIESDTTKINGVEKSFPTLNYVVEKSKLHGVEIEVDLPFGCGFGMSGAVALSAASLALPYIRAADLAHEAEVVNLTGLGDVVTQTFGGVVVRKNAACPSRAEVEKLCWNEELDFLILGELSTKDIIANDIVRKKIGEAGKRWMKEFMRKPTLENLFRCSNAFATETGLIEHVADIIEAVESSGGMAAMVMLGRSVFAFNAFEALKEFGEPFRARIDPCGVRRVYDG